MRSIWKGHIRFSLVTIPIQLYKAIETKNNISFRQIHKDDNGRVGYQKICHECENVLTKDDIVKGYEYDSDQYVMLDAEELASVKLKSTRAIDIEAFVDLSEVHPSRFESIYYIGPNGEVAGPTFALFIATLRKTKKAGVGRIIIRDREDVVLMAPYLNGMIMYKLRYPYELRSMEDVPDIKEASTINDDQLKLAETLVESLNVSFKDVNFEDRYRDALMDLVNQKIQGKEIVHIDKEEAEGPVVDIMSALKASIEKAKEVKRSA